ncbi:MAG: iron-containing alcohol dehydrogenase [Desulfurococcales archaeon]|nr:iron-containing alcohol dehydrogenase [Desulfurococcales archaeon]MCE4622595.1 iron-containing alcohol dehydrogenase [Desulfurococcales archaeon]MCE4627091.1 iron-containing alcohol dehydrogenase [Desulfurococcales archaeon]
MPIIVLPRKIYWNENVEDIVKSIIDEYGLKTILVVTDETLSKLEWFNNIINAIKDAGARLYTYEKVPPEPPIDIGEKIVSTLPSDTSLDGIFAIGGGSVIDAAKSALIKLLRPDVNIEDVAPFNPLGIEMKKPLLIAIPTTAGTGSDVSYGIVLTKETPEKREKIDVASYEVIPYVSILDPRLPGGAPRRLIIGAGLDALGHALEALTANQSNPMTDALAEKTIEEIMLWLPKAIEGDLEAMARVHLAATMAGIAFTNGGLGLIHAIAHPLGANLKIHHGTMVGIVTPHVVEFNSKDPTLKEKYNRVKMILENIHGWPKRESLADHIRALYEKIGFPSKIRDYGIDQEAYKDVKGKVLEEVFHDPSIAFATVLPTFEELEALLNRLY